MTGVPPPSVPGRSCEADVRIAVVSDIHGNVWALEALVADLALQGVDLVVNAGDHLSGPLEPAATADLLLELGWPAVAGNQDRQLLACAERPGGASDRYAFENVTDRHREWLRSLPAALVVDDVFVCHGTPGCDETYFLEDVGASGLEPAGDACLEARAAGVGQTLLVCGHSHRPGVRRVAPSRVVVNAGSVGLQAYAGARPSFHTVENGSPDLRYALCDRVDGAWRAEHRTVAYDTRPAVAAALRNGRPDWARALATGRL